ncbi:hypothetical protein PISMIDRAFT_123539 [Pisolithus microcarpus 441]|uniref:ATP-dependent DNA helicase n=1 Tax=Pisolithus microcarpus 441 TaxID=765257 RepID=A0A0C9YAE8_9AGAM|nr:hypothetical protein BKA83DRAFT_123539 [Pisolithus microcarpus]KIK10979.1 hypothetical protein PISMIDRAFT_123539 [Pisolithus microcarpus 441]
MHTTAHPYNKILAPCITFNATLQSGHSFQRRQFPLAPAYATMFNSSQGLTLDRVRCEIFSHGQLYTALSRIRHCNHACVLTHRNTYNYQCDVP